MYFSYPHKYRAIYVQRGKQTLCGYAPTLEAAVKLLGGSPGLVLDTDTRVLLHKQGF